MARIICPNCGENGSTILQTREKEVGLKRTHRCDSCENKFDTVEIPVAVLANLIVIGPSSEEELTEVIKDAYELAKEKLNENAVQQN